MGREILSGQMIGKQFGELLVISFDSTDKHNKSRVVCICSCGIKKVIVSSKLKNGHTKSCGHLRGKSTRKHKAITPISRSSEYRSWEALRSRCTNPNNNRYNEYGGRGISFCKSWLKFENFIADMGPKPHKDYSIDRIDNNKGYFKENCRWASRQLQEHNKRIKPSSGAYKHGKKFKAEICIGGKRVFLGIYDTQKEANQAYMVKKSELLSTLSQ